MLGSACKRLYGEGPEGDRTDHTYLDARFSCGNNCVSRYSRGNTEGNCAILCILHHELLVHDLVLFHFLVSLEAVHDRLLKLFGVEVKGVYYVVLSFALCAAKRPRLFDLSRLALVDGNRLHHLTQRTVGKQHNGHTVLVRDIESLTRKVSHFLNGSGCQNYHLEVTVSAALCCLEVVSLTGLDTAQTGAAALYVYDKCGKIRTCYVRNTLSLQRNSG